MSYDDTSLHGDLMCLEYDEQNNPMNPPSPFGFFLYHIVGRTFDSIDDLCTEFMNDSSILTCKDSMINWYGRCCGIPNPYFNDRYLTPEEYRVYIYLKNCQLLTIKDLQVCFNNCMGVDDYEVRVIESEVGILSTVDHLSYESNSEDVVSNIQANNSDDGKDKITNHSVDGDVNKLRGRTGHSYGLQVFVEVPQQGWSEDFLTFIRSFISVKGNVIVKEYSL